MTGTSLTGRLRIALGKPKNPEEALKILQRRRIENTLIKISCKEPNNIATQITAQLYIGGNNLEDKQVTFKEGYYEIFPSQDDLRMMYFFSDMKEVVLNEAKKWKQYLEENNIHVDMYDSQSGKMIVH